MENITLPFYQEEMEHEERRINVPFVGYISPNGDLIAFNKIFGGIHHDEWRNPVSKVYLKYVSFLMAKDEEVYKGFSSFYWNDFKFKDNDHLLSCLDSDIEITKVELLHTNYEFYKFELELLKFFRKAYSSGDFFKSIGREIVLPDYDSIKEYIELHNIFDEDKKYEYETYDKMKRILMDHFKDISVMYLGYDSIETYGTNNEELEVKDKDFDFLKNPRVITSSYPNINKRFFNYLIMDWRINQEMGYTYDEKCGLFKERSNLFNFHEDEVEKELGEEIKSIKRLVPLKDRYKYMI